MENRDEVIYIRVTPTEKKQILQKMQEMEIITLAAYGRKMLLNGYCIKLDLSDVKELIRLLRYAGNNLNQYAKKANETGSIYREDIQDLQKRLDEIWNQTREILVRLSSI